MIIQDENKKMFEEATLDIYKFKVADIITTSNLTDEDVEDEFPIG